MKSTAAEDAQIWAQQKIIKNRLVHDNRFQTELAKQNQVGATTSTALSEDIGKEILIII